MPSGKWWLCLCFLTVYETSFWSLGFILFPFMSPIHEFYQHLNKSSFLSFPFLFLARFIFWPNLSNINWEIILFIVKSGKKTSKLLKTDFVSTKKLCEESVIILLESSEGRKVISFKFCFRESLKSHFTQCRCFPLRSGILICSKLGTIISQSIF